MSDLPLEDLLPSLSDDQVLLSNFSILISRVLCEELSYFIKNFDGVVTSHIRHLYSEEMSKRSETVSI